MVMKKMYSKYVAHYITLHYASMLELMNTIVHSKINMMHTVVHFTIVLS